MRVLAVWVIAVWVLAGDERRSVRWVLGGKVLCVRKSALGVLCVRGLLGRV